MALSVIHFSDIHIKSSDDLIMKRIEQIRTACASVIHPGNDVLILVSGDIAFSGKVSQYNCAYDLMDSIGRYLAEQRGATVHYSFVPGNHDCDFDASISYRDALLSGVSSSKVDMAYYGQVSNVQSNYRDFAATYGLEESGLVCKSELVIDGNKVAILQFNTAWMSVLQESPGRIIMPSELFCRIEPSEYKAVFSVLHHPINWLNPDYKESFSSYIRTVTDIAFVGHEHQRDSFSTSAGKWCFSEIHAKELQDSNSRNSAFSVLNFDSAFQGYDTFEFSWSESEDAYTRENKEYSAFHKNIAAYDSVFHPNKNAIAEAQDIGIALKHFAKDDVILPDLYVWPELNKMDFSSEHSFSERIRDNVYELAIKGPVSIFTGSMSSGKSAFAKMIYLSLADEQICCLHVSGEAFFSQDPKKIVDVIEGVFISQYSIDHLEKFRQLQNHQKAIIIDDADCMRIHGDRRNAVINYLSGCFGSVILLFRASVEIHSLLSAECLKNVDDIPAYEILPLGNRKRKELIRRWYKLHNDARSDDEIDKQVETAIAQVDTFLGNGTSFIPAHPVFVLSVLQNSDAILNVKFNGSKYGFLYESLIQSSLSSSNVGYQQSGLYNADVGVVSSLAFYLLKEKNKKVFTEEELDVIVQDFAKQKKIPVSKDALLRRMIASNIFKKDPSLGSGYRFRYPYMFYFFAGRHIAYHLQQDDVKRMVTYMSNRLHNEDYGNIIIFVCHFANSQEVIEDVLTNAYYTLDNYAPFVFEKNIPLFDELQKNIEALLPAVVGGNEDVAENRDVRLKKMDDIGYMDGHVDEGSDTIDEDEAAIEKDLMAITASFKTMEVLGQILQNYPADIDGDFKVEIIEELHKLGMRSVQAIVETMGYMEESLITSIMERAAQEQKVFNRDEVAKATRYVLTTLISGMVRGMINMVASSLNSPLLLPAAAEALTKDNSISALLVIQELKLNYLKSPVYEELERLNNDLEKANNKFAQFVLSRIVAHYLRYNKCDHRLRNRMCALFKFSEKKVFVGNQKMLRIEGS